MTEQQQFVKTLRRNMTDAERLLWRHLRAHRLDGQKFRRQHPIGPYVVDFIHFGARLIVEADGGHHNESIKDEVRDVWLQSQAFKIMRFWNDEILRNTDVVLAMIWAAVSSIPPLPQPLSRKWRGE